MIASAYRLSLVDNFLCAPFFFRSDLGHARCHIVYTMAQISNEAILRIGNPT